ncbi:DUF533 domain-containing protein [Tropicimonas aquimaris]|uniref:DUF533 domain-containing protein n=1 Tax=Tropicimonas aquimaris TaxID=914152 RepID=A0ABW3ILU7_9RHOB
MSLVSTLAKVAAGVVIAKGVKGMVSGGGSQTAQPTGAGQASAGGGIEDMLGQILGGGSAPGGGSAGGLQDMLGQVLGGGTTSRGAAPGGSIQDMLGQVLGGGAARGGASGGSLQDMMGAILGGGAGAAAGRGGLGGALNELSELSRPGGGSAGGGFGDKLNQSLQNFGEPDEPPTAAEEDLAAVMLRAMIQAAKSDGTLDDTEKKRLLERLGQVSQEEADFVQAELQRPVDPTAIARSVPRGAEHQVYMMAAMAIDLDHKSEARFLHELAQGMGLNGQVANAIHDKLGQPHLYR